MKMTIEYLKSLDDPRHVEFPRGFSDQAALLRFTKFKDELSPVFPSMAAESGREIQDATFHGEIRIRLKQSFVIVRTSNFGELVAVRDEDGVLPIEEAELIENTAKRLGYKVVDFLVLSRDYDGPTRGVSGFKDWWNRFFDYV